MNAPPDRVPRRRLDAETRRLAIVEAGRAAFAGASYSQVSVDQVAQAAGASPALVFRYFGNKGGLYAAVVEDALGRLAARQREADAALPRGTSSRDRVRTALLLYLDNVAGHPAAWATPFIGGQEEPREALDVRRASRGAHVQALRELLQLPPWPRRDFALWGYFGFVDQACLAWVEQGSRPDARDALVDACLGALEGALGDWGG